MIYEGGSSIKPFNLEKFICLETQESQYTANVLKWWTKVKTHSFGCLWCLIFLNSLFLRKRLSSGFAYEHISCSRCQQIFFLEPLISSTSVVNLFKCIGKWGLELLWLFGVLCDTLESPIRKIDCSH